jgi:hypothetical protein
VFAWSDFHFNSTSGTAVKHAWNTQSMAQPSEGFDMEDRISDANETKW